VADILLHDVVPLTYAAYWLIYPPCYLAYALARGATTGWYPYPFS
jgi:hypothetical protein